MKKERKKTMEMRDIRRGEIYFADFPNTIGSEQSGNRPVLIVQNDIGNIHSPTVIAAAITSRNKKKHLPTHVWIGYLPGAWSDSIVLTEQIKTIDKRRLEMYITKLDEERMGLVDQALEISVGLKPINSLNSEFSETNEEESQ